VIKKILSKLKQKPLSEEKTVEIVSKKIGKQIYTGPFAGLNIPEILIPKMKLAEILGLYESCLHPAISDLVNRKIENIMIIGGHKGYYSAGLSNFLRPKKMYVYEMDDAYLPLIETWIKINNLSPFIMGKEATTEILKNFQDKIDFLLIDCEGAEMFLLQPDSYKWQKKADVLVEIHHFYNNKIMGTIIERFRDTHEISVIYDDLNEDLKIKNILIGLGINGSFRGHPYHRWIINENKNRIITHGVFLYMKRKF
jgi:hypothetical protein